MLRFGIILTSLVMSSALTVRAVSAAADDDPPLPVCAATIFDSAPFTVCTADLNTGDLRLFHRHGDGSLIGQPSAIVPGQADEIVFAMNAGMFHLDRRPVGHYVEAGVETARLIRGDGPGNFQLLPNGVFWIVDGEMGVMETEAFAEVEMEVDYATQSGPMLVIDGELHPAFRMQSDSLHIRNGVGVSQDGQRAVFAISDAPVNFHTFARLFRDELELDNALFLDGKVSLLYAPELGRSDIGLSVGPMAAFVRPVGD
ncbi:MAG: phosphodiester glycosidase family protein [Pseudomonadota bacterium]